MCHALPAPLSPRCFSILVVTAFTSPTSFIIATIPVHLSRTTGSDDLYSQLVEGAYYSLGRNVTDPDPDPGPGHDELEEEKGQGEEGDKKKQKQKHKQKQKLRKKKPVLGVYAAVETVTLIPSSEPKSAPNPLNDYDDDEKNSARNIHIQNHTSTTPEPQTQKDTDTDTDTDNGRGSARTRGSGGTIEWIMATTSDAKGYLPMFVQRPNLPAAVARDVGYFIRWMNSVGYKKMGKKLNGI
jgi:Protein of unknown function (DUF3074)